MGSGTWSSKSFSTYTTNTHGLSLDEYENNSYSTQEIFTSRKLASELNPYGVMRECCDSAEHPNSFPIILAPDVTGSMGGAARKVAQKLNTLMTELYEDKSIKDPEFCIIAIGDVAYDRAPVQMTQFESDIRIAEQLDKVYFEGGGGGNGFESYTAAWYMGLYHCALDCWKRGKKGLIITLGDECPNPYIPARNFRAITGDKLPEGDVETKPLLEAVKEKFEVYHLSVNDEDSSYEWHNNNHCLDKKWTALLGDHYKVVTLDNLIPTIVKIIKENADNDIFETVVSNTNTTISDDGFIDW